MLNKLGHKLGSLWDIKEEFRSKVFLQALTFLFLMACLVIWRPLKYSVFSKMVGSSYVPVAKLYSLFLLIPLILFYSKMVDWLRRHHLLYWFTIFHGLGGLFFFYFFSHPVYGIANTNVDVARYIGWAYFVFMESFNAFLSTSFWAFADSINKPKDAQNYYGFIVAGSKVGGIISAGLLYLALSFMSVSYEATMIPKIFLIGSFLLFAAAFMVYLLVKIVPESKMHGYEGVYQLEKKREKKSRRMSFIQALIKPFDGLIIMVKKPYVLGIFALVFCYETIIVIFDYYLQLQVDQASSSIGSMTSYYALYYLMLNLVGLAISLLGTTPILRLFGIRLSLFVFPFFCLITLTIVLLFPSTWILFAVAVGLRAVNYAFNHPTREILYIPTTKDIKFKAKAWTDAFGSRIAKSTGSCVNLSMNALKPAAALFSSMSFCIGMTGLWIVVTFFLGKHLQHALDNKLIIGQNDENQKNNNPDQKNTNYQTT
ncbi:MAG: Npt1/Npt2 family nucleotide transporter [bacterium]